MNAKQWYQRRVAITAGDDTQVTAFSAYMFVFLDYRMAFDKVPVLFAVLLLAAVGLAQQEFEEEPVQEWPAGISPLDTLSFWDEDKLAASPGEGAKGCCLPNAFTATLFTEVRREGGKLDRKPKAKPRDRTLRFMEVVYADQNNKRIAQDVYVARGRNTTRIGYILLFNTTGNSSATLYTFCRAKQKCIRKDLAGAQFRQMCLPDNSTLLGSFFLGAGARTLPTQSWGYLYRDRRIAVAANVILSPSNCVPVIAGQKIFTRKSFAYGEDDDKRPQVTTVGTLYTNFTTSIRDPSVFTPPSYCNKFDDTLELFDENIDFTTIIDRYVAVP